MGATILITREERSGERELGEELGLRLVFMPLTKSEMLDGQHPTLVALSEEHPASSFPHLAFTSRNAIEALKQANLLHLLEHQTIWCVGPSTASALGDIPHHISPGTTGEDLAKFMLASGVTGDVLHICGEPHRPEFGSRMLEAGCRMQEWVVYETVPIEAELPSEKIDAVAFFSPAAVKQFKALGWDKHVQVPYIAIGPTTSSELSPSSCAVSDSATFRGVLETTRKMLNVEG
jgi:uroporphyrinogen-III synthase